MPTKRTIAEATLCFPCERYPGQIEEILRVLPMFEALEEYFDVEFSCGEGIYPSDLLAGDDAFVEKHKHLDGNVCYKTLPRVKSTQGKLKKNKPYTFKVVATEDKYGKVTEYAYYLNNRCKHREDVSY